MKEWLLELNKVSASYGETLVLHEVSIKIDEGEVVALMGPNGAGKSSILKAIFGLLPHRGDVLFEGKKIFPKPHELVPMGIVYVPQGRCIFRSLSVEENLEIGGYSIKNKSEVARRVENIYSLFLS